MIPPNSRKQWTPEEDEELRIRIGRKEPQRKIAQALGRTFTAVSSRAEHLGMRLPPPLRPRHKD
jgi:hypothetical protein